MKRFLSIRVLLQSITALMAVTAVAFCALGFAKAYERRATAERVLRLVSVERDLFTALQHIRLERGGLNSALALPPISAPLGSEAELSPRKRRPSVSRRLAARLPNCRRTARRRCRRRSPTSPRSVRRSSASAPRPSRRCGIQWAERPADLGPRFVAADNALALSIGDLATG